MVIWKRSRVKKIGPVSNPKSCLMSDVLALLILLLTRYSLLLCLSTYSHNMHLFKCHSENPSRHNSFDDLISDKALSDSETGTSMFLLTEVGGFAHGLWCPVYSLCSIVVSVAYFYL